MDSTDTVTDQQLKTIADAYEREPTDLGITTLQLLNNDVKEIIEKYPTKREQRYEILRLWKMKNQVCNSPRYLAGLLSNDHGISREHVNTLKTRPIGNIKKEDEVKEETKPFKREPLQPVDNLNVSLKEPQPLEDPPHQPTKKLKTASKSTNKKKTLSSELHKYEGDFKNIDVKVVSLGEPFLSPGKDNNKVLHRAAVFCDATALVLGIISTEKWNFLLKLNNNITLKSVPFKGLKARIDGDSKTKLAELSTEIEIPKDILKGAKSIAVDRITEKKKIEDLLRSSYLYGDIECKVVNKVVKESEREDVEDICILQVEEDSTCYDIKISDHLQKKLEDLKSGSNVQITYVDSQEQTNDGITSRFLTTTHHSRIVKLEDGQEMTK